LVEGEPLKVPKSKEDRSGGKISRRCFLESSLLGASALALGASVGGCFRAQASVGSGASGYSGGAPLSLNPSPSPHQGRVALVRASAFPSHRDVIQRVITLSGGLGFIQPGQNVLLKPAVNSPNPYPATTDPETILILAEMVKEAGGWPLVADRTTFIRSTKTAFEKTGIRDAAKQAGIQALCLEDDESVPVQHELAEHWRGNSIRIYRSVARADHVINLCTPRTHFIGDFTMSMKNLVGIVDALSRLPMHVPWGLKERLAEISLVVQPSLIVMDGRQGFSSGGPDSGDLVHPDFVAAGSDPVALDAIGLAHLRLEGANEAISEDSVWQIPMMKRAVELGLGARNASQIVLIGADPATEAALRSQLL
jgi:uncharacterized protein (DUF362 family)